MTILSIPVSARGDRRMRSCADAAPGPRPAGWRVWCVAASGSGYLMARSVDEAARSDGPRVHAVGRWSNRVATASTFPPPGLFTGSAEVIAATMARPEVSPGGLGAAIRMVTFFANRAGRTLPAARAAELARAKALLRDRRAVAPLRPASERAPGRYHHVALGPVLVERRARGWVMRRGADEPPIPLGPDAWSYLRRA